MNLRSLRSDIFLPLLAATLLLGGCQATVNPTLNGASVSVPTSLPERMQSAELTDEELRKLQSLLPEKMRVRTHVADCDCGIPAFRVSMNLDDGTQLALHFVHGEDEMLIVEPETLSGIIRLDPGAHDIFEEVSRRARMISPSALPVILDQGLHNPQLVIHAVDAPAEALAVLLGAELLAAGASKDRFSGIIMTDSPREGLEALRGEVPNLPTLDHSGAHELEMDDPETDAHDTTEPKMDQRLSLNMVSVSSEELDQLLKSTGVVVEGCGGDLAITIGARNIAYSELSDALNAFYEARPECAASANASADESEQSLEDLLTSGDLRLAATIEQGYTRHALFETSDAEALLVTDMAVAGTGSSPLTYRFLPGFEAGRVVLEDGTEYRLEAKPTL